MAKSASAFVADYFGGSNCRTDRCEHYRRKDSESGQSWCWLKDGMGAEGREKECPAYVRAIDRKADAK